jgi:hypothetical protein
METCNKVPEMVKNWEWTQHIEVNLGWICILTSPSRHKEWMTYLICQLTSVTKNKGRHLSSYRLNLLESRKDKHCCLPHSWLGLADDIHSKNCLWYAFMLNCSIKPMIGMCLLDSSPLHEKNAKTSFHDSSKFQVVKKDFTCKVQNMHDLNQNYCLHGNHQDIANFTDRDQRLCKTMSHDNKIWNKLN